MRIFIFTLGCRSNQYESDSLAYRFQCQGHEIVSNIQGADICIVNTCTVTHRADYDSRRIIRKIIRLNPKAICIVTGCYAQLRAQELASIPGLDYIIGNREKPLIPQVDFKKQSKPQIWVSRNPTSKDTLWGFPPALTSRHTRAYLKIQDGCNEFCSYCVIVYARGRIRSLPLDEVKRRLSQLEDHGVKEIILTGIHLGKYGIDLNASFTKLLKEIKGLNSGYRLRLSSLNPDEVTNDLIKLLEEWPGLCPHLHLSIQSGSSEILKRMRRRYNSRQIRDLLEALFHLKLKVPLAIGVDLIIGFPGESEEDFNQTLKLVQDYPLAYCHIFSYSDRPGTKASRLPEKIPPEVIHQRVQLLRKVDKAKRMTFAHRNLELWHDVIIERPKGDNLYLGRTANYLRALIKSRSRLNSGQIIKVKLTEIQNGLLFGVI